MRTKGGIQMAVSEQPSGTITLVDGAATVVDQVFSPDGQTLYVARSDGTISKFDVATRQETAHWKVGLTLGGIDVTPDGKSIIATELTQVSRSGDQWDTKSVIATYTVDTETGTVGTQTYAKSGYDTPFHDVVTTNDGQAIFVGNDQWQSLEFVDLATHKLTSKTGSYYGPTLSTNADHSKILIMQNGISDAALDLLTVGGKVESHGGYEDGVQGYNNAIQAISADGGLVAQGLGSQLHVYDGKLDHMFDVNAYKDLGLGSIIGVAFAPNGRTLYALDADGQLLAISTRSWEPQASWTLPPDTEFPGPRYGSSMVMSSDGHTLSIIGTNGATLVDVAKGSGSYHGSIGADTLAGGSGSDTYVVNHSRDTVTEKAGEGYDIVRASVTHTLGDNVERLELTGDAHRGTGNALDNAIHSGAGNDSLRGMRGDDALYGSGGEDRLSGDSGEDLLDGGAGADIMIGGKDDDRYIASSRTDQVVELSGGGNDTVESAASFTLPDHVEALWLTGTAERGTGNGLGNLIIGNSGDNKLAGLAGNDTLAAGGGGADTLTGGDGADRFRFDTFDRNGASWRSADQITDFSSTQKDRIDLRSIDANFGRAGNQAFSFIADAAFDGHAGQLRTQHDGGRIMIEADTDGDKLIDFVIRLDGVGSIAAGDFML
jgi:Ca2+-binding RTX toxin-like protein